METFSDKIEQARSRVDRLLALQRTSQHALENERAELRKLKADVVVAEEAHQAVQTVALTVQTQAHKRIASVVSRCLAAVFEQPYVFQIIFERKRGRTEANLVFERGGNLVDPMTASGGGVVDVAAFALRLSCLLLAKPPLRRLLLADEPFHNLSQQYQPRVAELLMSLSKELDMQIVMVTHDAEFVQGHVVRIT